MSRLAVRKASDRSPFDEDTFVSKRLLFLRDKEAGTPKFVLSYLFKITLLTLPIWLGITLWSQSVFADFPSTDNKPSDDPYGASGTPDTFGNLGTILWVIVVLFIIVVLIVILIKYLSQRSRGGLMNRSIRTMGGVMLGQNKSLQMIEVGSSIYLVGVGDQVTLVDKIDDPDEVARIMVSFQAEQMARNTTVSAWIQNIVGSIRKSKQPTSDESEQLTASFHEVFQQKMNQMPNRKQMVENLLRDDENQTDRSMDK